MKKEFDGFASQASTEKGEDELSRPNYTTERRSSFVTADDVANGGHHQDHEMSAMDGGPRPYANLSIADGNSITMTPTTQFLEQPVIFNVAKGEAAQSASGGQRSHGGASGTSPLDDLLVDLKYDSPPMIMTCVAGLAGFALGAVLNKIGLTFNAQLWVGFVGYFFISVAECLTLPLIFTSVTICVANLIMSKKTKSVMVRIGIYFVMASFLSCCVALGVSYIFVSTFERKPDLPPTVLSASLNLMCPNGKFLAKDSSKCEGKQQRDAMTFLATNITGASLQVTGAVYTHYTFAGQISYFFDNLFAQNITEAFANSAFLAVTVFSILFGVGLVLAHDPATGEQNHAFVLIKQVDLVLELILNWLMPWTPLGTFSAMTFYIMQGTITQAAFTETLYFTIAMAVTLVIYFFLVLCVGYFVLVRKNPFQFVWFLLPAMIFMFGSSNYTASIPVLMRSIEGSKSVSRTLSQYTVCLGVSFSLSGTAAFFVVSTIFMAYTGGVEHLLTPGRLIALVIISTLSSIGMPHEAGFSLSYLATIWTTLFPIPLPASFMYLSWVEWLVKRMRRMTNVMVIAFIARVIAEQLDETVEDEEDRAFVDRPVGLAHI